MILMDDRSARAVLVRKGSDLAGRQRKSAEFTGLNLMRSGISVRTSAPTKTTITARRATRVTRPKSRNRVLSDSCPFVYYQT
jgi:hypothetical protein